MDFQLIIVGICLLAALLFIARKIVSTLRRKGPPSCGGCPNERKCGSRQGTIQPPCSLEELRPGRQK